jgi:hypothetical protein
MHFHGENLKKKGPTKRVDFINKLLKLKGSIHKLKQGWTIYFYMKKRRRKSDLYIYKIDIQGARERNYVQGQPLELLWCFGR